MCDAGFKIHGWKVNRTLRRAFYYLLAYRAYD